jgi:hypothetical protein
LSLNARQRRLQSLDAGVFLVCRGLFKEFIRQTRLDVRPLLPFDFEISQVAPGGSPPVISSSNVLRKLPFERLLLFIAANTKTSLSRLYPACSSFAQGGLLFLFETLGRIEEDIMTHDRRPWSEQDTAEVETVIAPAAIERALAIYQQLQPRDQSVIVQARKS